MTSDYTRNGYLDGWLRPDTPAPPAPTREKNTQYLREGRAERGRYMVFWLRRPAQGLPIVDWTRNHDLLSDAIRASDEHPEWGPSAVWDRREERWVYDWPFHWEAAG